MHRLVIGFAVAAGLSAAAGVWERLETTAGLAILYGLRGPVAPPPAAAVLGLREDFRETLALDAAALSRTHPRLAACLPSEAVAGLRRARSVEDLPRAVIGCAVRFAMEDGAALVALDILFHRPGPPEDDAFLGRELRRVGETFVLERFEMDAATGAVLRRGPIAPVEEGATGRGFFLIETVDGRPLRFVTGLAAYPAATPLHRAARREGPDAPMGDRAYATRGFNVYGPTGTVPTVDVGELFARPDPTRFAGKAVFLGWTAGVAGDRRDAFSGAWPGRGPGALDGVELIATAYLNEGAGGEMRRAAVWAEAALSALLAAAFAVACASLRGVGGVGAAAALAAAHVGSSVAAFSAFALWLPVAAPVFVYLPAAVGLRALGRYARVRRALGRLVSARLLTAGAEEPQSRPAHPTRHTVVLFDMVGSTATTDLIGVEAQRGRLDTAFAGFARAVEAEGGFVLKFTGDGAMALFAEADLGSRHADAACRAMGAFAAHLRDANAATPGQPALRVRAGISSGPVLVGYVGAADRGVIDAIGEPVNMAARLESLCKREMPGEDVAVAVAASTAATAGVKGLVRLGERRLAGKAEPAEIFRLDVG